MKLKARRLPIGTGDILIAIMTQEDATNLDLNHTDRILIKKGRKKAIATLDISNTKCIGTCHLGKSIVKQGEIGLFEETGFLNSC